MPRAKARSKTPPAPAADPLDALLASAQRAAGELLPADRAKRLRAWLAALAAGERAAGGGPAGYPESLTARERAVRRLRGRGIREGP